jgi:hypothetical protein
MIRLFRWIAPVLLLLGGWISPASAQNNPPPGAPAAKPEQTASALPYAMGVLYTILILWIVCMPSRKGNN